MNGVANFNHDYRPSINAPKQLQPPMHNGRPLVKMSNTKAKAIISAKIMRKFKLAFV